MDVIDIECDHGEDYVRLKNVDVGVIHELTLALSHRPLAQELVHIARRMFQAVRAAAHVANFDVPSSNPKGCLM
jgi:hypothetical protein